MAFVRNQRRVPCTSYCRCSEIPDHLLQELIIFDMAMWDFRFGRISSLPADVLFKMPAEFCRRHEITYVEPWDDPDTVPGPRVNTLFELSFKVTAMLCHNFVRRTFSSHHFGEVVIWHYRQFFNGTPLPTT